MQSKASQKNEVPTTKGKLETKREELILEKVFVKFITSWYQERTINVHQYEKARKEIELLKTCNGKTKGNKGRKKDDEVDKVKGLPDYQSYDKATTKNPNRPNSSKPAKESAKGSGPAKNHRLQYMPEAGQVSTASDVEMQRVIAENIELRNKIDRLKEKMLTQSADLRIEINDKNKKLERLSKALDNSKAQVEDLTLRLSKLAGDKLRDGNPDLADLSDPNRPTELGKHFSELYDNEWSDAFENIPLKDEDKRVGLLHGVVMKAFKFSCETFDDQTSQVRNVLLGLAEENDSGVDADGDKTKRVTKIHNQLKDIRKELASDTAKNVAKEFQSTTLKQYVSAFIDEKKIDPTLNKYAKACVELCWFMVTRDPPLALSEDKKDQAFDTNVYRPYTKSVKDLKNPVVRLHVWPALLLHEDGPLVAKGVAQPGEGKIK